MSALLDRTRPTQEDRVYALEELLCRWHQWQDQRLFVRGYARSSLVLGNYRSSRQYDDMNGALDCAIDDSQMQTVDFHVNEIGNPHRWALYELARNLSVGVFVFRNPRLPEDVQARMAIVESARAMLVIKLSSAGLL